MVAATGDWRAGLEATPSTPGPGPTEASSLPRRARARRAGLLVLALAALACERFQRPGFEDWKPPPAPAAPSAAAPREPCSARALLRRAYFGDLHVHTGFSMDARVWGLAATPDDAYRFALGEAIELPDPETGATRRVRLERPLDFAAVTDHAEWMAEVALCTTPGSSVYDDRGCRIFRGETQSWLARLLGLRDMARRMPGIAGAFRRNRAICGDGARRCREALYDAWAATRAAAERWYDRSSACRFTTFVAWEYSETPANSKVHRNVILRSEIAPELPLSWIDTPTARELRHELRRLCLDSGSGCDAIAIPHNPNLANGRTFVVETRHEPLEVQRSEARLRAQLEPLLEMMQIKGESECRNGLPDVAGAPDELCDFEKYRDLPGPEVRSCGEGTGSGGQAGRGCISRLDYARYALVEGLREEARIGVNPYRFGLIGSTDSHSATPGAVDEARPDVPFGRVDRSARQRLDRGRSPGLGPTLFRNPGGLVGLYAPENTRDALFDAMRRREAFATSGPRIRPRLFGAWELPADLCERGDAIARGYALGVPMGDLLPARGGPGAAPTFLLTALRDPGSRERPGGLLERIQIVKGWVGEAGATHQAVFDVAGEAGRGSVDLATCEPRGPGAESLCGVWTDPDFDPARPAVYYARILENPSCRWSTWQCLAFAPGERPSGCSDPRIPRTVQERAWTSPIWYSP